MPTKYYLLLFLLLNAASGLARQGINANNVILRGHITGGHTRVMLLDYRGSDGKKIYYRASVKKGKFAFKGMLTSPVYAWISRGMNGKPHPSNAIEIFITPGMTVSLRENDFDHAIIGGSPMQQDYDELQRRKKVLYNKILTFEREGNKISDRGNTPENHAAVLELGKKEAVINEQLKQMDFRFITGHPASYLGGYLLDSYFHSRLLRRDSAEMFYKLLTPQIQNSIAGRSVKNDINKRRRSAVGSMVVMPKGLDSNGNKVSFSSIKIKNSLVLYFWQSWCGGKDISHLTQLYNKYHSKGLEVATASLDYNKRDWKDTVREAHIGMWRNILLNTGLGDLYDIDGMPPALCLLVDKTGRIIGRYHGSGNIYYRNDYNEGDFADLDKKLVATFR